MKFTVDQQEHYTLLELQEENFNSLVSPDLKSKFVFYNNEGVKNLILDLSNVKYVDSSGLSAILTGERLWKSSGNFVLAGELHENIRKLITISRLDSVLTLIPTQQEAIDYILMDALEQELRGGAEDEEELI